MFSDQHSFTPTDLAEKLPLEQFNDLFNEWVVQFGSTYRGFEVLVYFLRKCGQRFLVKAE